MKEQTRQKIYGLVLGVSFMIALPIAFSSMMSSQDDSSVLLRKTVSYFYPNENKYNNNNVANDISTLVIEDDSVASGEEVMAEKNAQELNVKDANCSGNKICVQDDFNKKDDLNNSSDLCTDSGLCDKNGQQEMKNDQAGLSLETYNLDTIIGEIELTDSDLLAYHKPQDESVGKESDSPDFCTVDLDYFDDAFFIGDSRTLGIMEYGGLDKAVFFADSGMSVIKLYDSKLKVEGLGKVSFEEALCAKNYGKVYIMLGMNEMGYEHDYIMGKYQNIIDDIKEVQPDALIYVCANLHLTKDAQGEIMNNPDLDRLNQKIKEFADNEKIFYLDINPYYDDGEGNLNPEYSTDGVHIYAKYYQEWVNWLCTKAIVG